MKAAVNYRYGSPEVIEIKEVKKPSPSAEEVLVNIKATTVNRTDSAGLRARPFLVRLATGIFKPKIPILGTEFAGIVESTGTDVKSFKKGDKVFGFNDSGMSAHAEYICLHENLAITKMPGNVSFEQGAPSFEGAHYAYNFINKVELKSGQKVLVNGATGGIGSAAVQLLKYFGTNVTAVCKGKDSDLVKSLGADRVIDFTTEDFTKSTDKYDYVFDTVGKSSFSKCRPLLKKNGVYISSELGAWSQNIFFALLTPIFCKKKVIFPLPRDSKASVNLIKKLIEENKFKAVIDRTYVLDDIAEAYRYVEKGQKTGNVVIQV